MHIDSIFLVELQDYVDPEQLHIVLFPPPDHSVAVIRYGWDTEHETVIDDTCDVTVIPVKPERGDTPTDVARRTLTTVFGEYRDMLVILHLDDDAHLLTRSFATVVEEIKEHAEDWQSPVAGVMVVK